MYDQQWLCRSGLATFVAGTPLHSHMSHVLVTVPTLCTGGTALDQKWLLPIEPGPEEKARNNIITAFTPMCLYAALCTITYTLHRTPSFNC